jgi:hypothetical protein
MPTYTAQRQREPEARGQSWTDDAPPALVEADDAVDAALIAIRQLRVLPKRQRLLLWEGDTTRGKPRIFHSGS